MDSREGWACVVGFVLGALFFAFLASKTSAQFHEDRARVYVNERRTDLGMDAIPETECPFCYPLHADEPQPPEVFLDDEPWVTGHHPMPSDGAVR